MLKRLFWLLLLGVASWLLLKRMLRRPLVAVRGKVVLITGASAGIGRAAALAFAREGAHLVLAARNEAALVDVQAELASYGGRVLVVPTDVTVDSDLEALVAAALAEFGRLDVLVNNAGIGLGGLLQDASPARLNQVIDTNLYGAMRLTQLVTPLMVGQGVGHIINVGAGLSKVPMPGMAAYVASKAALAAFTDSLRRELDNDGVRVSLIVPGLTRTAFVGDFDLAKMPAGIVVQEPSVPAQAIVDAVIYGDREIVLGGNQPVVGPVQLLVLLEQVAPWLVDRYYHWIFTPNLIAELEKLNG